MWNNAVALMLVAHGIGHAVGFWMPVPLWFALAWLIPGATFVVGAWGFWTHATWWPMILLLAAIGSLLLILLSRVGLQPGPYASAFVFDAIVLVALLLPWSRQLLFER